MVSLRSAQNKIIKKNKKIRQDDNIIFIFIFMMSILNCGILKIPKRIAIHINHADINKRSKRNYVLGN